MWPENEPALNLFSSISTQWRIGMAGPIGLDYNVAFACMDRLRLSASAFEQLFDDLRVMEAEALSIFNKKE